MGSLASFMNKFNPGGDDPGLGEESLVVAERPGALAAFVDKFGGISESFFFYNNTVEIRFDKVEHQYFLVDPDLGNLTLLLNISSVSKIIDRSPALIPWSARVAIEKLLRTIPTVTLPDGTIKLADITLEAFTKIALEAKSAHKDKFEDAGDVGKMGHDWIEKYIKAILAKNDAAVQAMFPVSCADYRATNAALAALDWMKRHNIRWIETERKVYSKKHNFVGTLDGLCRTDSCDDPTCCARPFKDRLTLVDWKTSNYLYIEYLFQTAAYENNYEEEFGVDIEDRWILRLDKETAEFQPWHLEAGDYAEDFAGFLACLELKRLVLSVDERMRAQKASIREAKKIAKASAREIAKAAEKVRKAEAKAEAKRVKQEEKERIKAEAKATREKLRAEAKQAKVAKIQKEATAFIPLPEMNTGIATVLKAPAFQDVSVRENLPLRLSAEASKVFVEVILNPPAPNPALLDAVKKHTEQIERITGAVLYEDEPIAPKRFVIPTE